MTGDINGNAVPSRNADFSVPIRSVRPSLRESSVEEAKQSFSTAHSLAASVANWLRTTHWVLSNDDFLKQQI